MLRKHRKMKDLFCCWPPSLGKIVGAHPHHHNHHHYKYDNHYRPTPTTETETGTNHHRLNMKHPIETLLEPIRYSMAFLTLFSIMSTIIVAILLVPLDSLQLLAQLLSLIVSLSGLFGTIRRSILLSSIYALAMLLFLFLQTSYFFVLLKLVQEVKINENGNGNNSHHQKWWFQSLAKTNTNAGGTAATHGNGSDNLVATTTTISPSTTITATTANWVAMSVVANKPSYFPRHYQQSNTNIWYNNDKRETENSEDVDDDLYPDPDLDDDPDDQYYYYYWKVKRKRMKNLKINSNLFRDYSTSTSTSSTTTTSTLPTSSVNYQNGPYYKNKNGDGNEILDYVDNDHNGYQLPSSYVHVRRITRMLNEELSYLSLLTVPMIAWLPPSLFMESIAVLVLTMQALAGGCFLYALHRSEQYYCGRACKSISGSSDEDDVNALVAAAAAAVNTAADDYHIKLPIYLDY